MQAAIAACERSWSGKLNAWSATGKINRCDIAKKKSDRNFCFRNMYERCKAIAKMQRVKWMWWSIEGHGILCCFIPSSEFVRCGDWFFVCFFVFWIYLFIPLHFSSCCFSLWSVEFPLPVLLSCCSYLRLWLSLCFPRCFLPWVYLCCSDGPRSEFRVHSPRTCMCRRTRWNLSLFPPWPGRFLRLRARISAKPRENGCRKASPGHTTNKIEIIHRNTREKSTRMIECTNQIQNRSTNKQGRREENRENEAGSTSENDNNEQAKMNALIWRVMIECCRSVSCVDVITHSRDNIDPLIDAFTQ